MDTGLRTRLSVGGHRTGRRFPASIRCQVSRRRWYRAHNASIVSGYLRHHDLAELEAMPERFFLNVALLRVLYAHTLNAAPRLALGRFAPLGRALGDPRLGMAGLFLALGRVLPDHRPLRNSLDAYLGNEHAIGRMIDYGVIAPRLEALYDWSAEELSDRRSTRPDSRRQPDLRMVLRRSRRVAAGARVTAGAIAQGCDFSPLETCAGVPTNGPATAVPVAQRFASMRDQVAAVGGPPQL